MGCVKLAHEMSDILDEHRIFDSAEKYEHNNPAGAMVFGRLHVLVVGEKSFIGAGLIECLELRNALVTGTNRNSLNLLDVPEHLPTFDAVFICAAMSRFIECEDVRITYRVNVDGPIAVAKAAHPAKIIFLSSEAVERALHTNYGTQKAMAEMGLRAVCDPVIVRLSQVKPDTLESCCSFLADLMHKPGGVYHWPSNHTLNISNGVSAQEKSLVI